MFSPPRSSPATRSSNTSDQETPQAESVNSSHKRRRVTTGCLTCRSRRVKCDEVRPRCGRCQKAHRECKWEPVDTSRASSSSRTPTGEKYRRRTGVACSTCRSSKVRCIPSAAGAPCLRCTDRNELCDLSSMASSSRISTTDSASHPGNTNTLLAIAPNNLAADSSTSMAGHMPLPAPSEDLPVGVELMQIVTDYFAGPAQHIFFNFIHEPTFIASVQDGTAHPNLLLAVCALSLRLSSNPTAQAIQRADIWAEKGKKALLSGVFEQFGLQDLMALLLLARLAYVKGNLLAHWLLSALAPRMASALDLFGTAQSASFVEQETRRRITWSVFLWDSFVNGGEVELQQVHLTRMRMPLPCSEEAFIYGVGGEGPLLEEFYLAPGIHSLSAHICFIATIRLKILHHVKRMPDIESQPWLPGSHFRQLEDELTHFTARLPVHMLATAAAFSQRRQELIPFIAFHALLGACYCDLYRAGPLYQRCGASPPVEFVEKCHSQRRNAARRICGLFAQTLVHRTRIWDLFVPIAAFVATRILTSEMIQPLNEAESVRSALQCLRNMKGLSPSIMRLYAASCKLVAEVGMWAILEPDELITFGLDPGSRPASPGGLTMNRFSSVAQVRKQVSATLPFTPQPLTMQPVTDTFVEESLMHPDWGINGVATSDDFSFLNEILGMDGIM